MQPRDQLTAKEVQVATFVWEGLTNREIADIRQAGRMEPAGTCALRGQPRWDELDRGTRLETRGVVSVP